MKPVIFAFPGNEKLARSLDASDMEIATLECGRYPDGETRVRLHGELKGREVLLACNLDRPDDKLLPIAFAASAARDMGARRVGLVAPYLAYMRQDTHFVPGDAVSAAQFARLLGGIIDWLVCVDPHLHRIKWLSEVYSIPATVVRSAPAIGAWIAANVDQPVIIGPDDESEQWVSEVARLAGAPYEIFNKVRSGDRDVKVSMGHPTRWRERTPVLLDDIISSGATMIATVGNLLEAGMRPPVCIGVHAVFADTAYRQLLDSGVADLVTCNTLEHASNAIDVHPLIAAGVRDLLQLA